MGTEKRVVLFDLDGTLSDPREGITGCLRHALSEVGQAAPPARDLERYIGPPLQDTLCTLMPDADQALRDRALTLYRSRYNAVGYRQNQLYDGIAELLDALTQRGHKLYVATSKNQVSAEQVIAHFGITAAFERVYGSRLDGGLMHKTELIGHILTAEGLPPARTVMVGDRDLDIRGAKANGVTAMAVTYGFGSLDELTRADPDGICHRPSDLLALLSGAG